jgi:glutaredoxin
VARITLIGKAGCHLCEDAREVVARVAAEAGADVEELSIDDDPDLAERYWEQVPVVLVDGAQHTFFRVDEDRLRQALAGRRSWLRGR